MELGLGGKVAIVTGGSKGIGRAVALGLLKEGASVLITARGNEALKETVAAAGDAKSRIEAMSADLTRFDEVKRVVARCIERFGRVDILVNNAGAIRSGNFFELSDEVWHSDLELKLFGYVRMAREVLEILERQHSGVIINIIGGAAWNPRANYTMGGIANAGLNNFSKALADEAAPHGVRVVGINPGPIMTERLLSLRGVRSESELPPGAFSQLTPLGRVGKPEEVADLTLFLASDRAAFITGANVTIDGGSNKGLIG